MGGTKKIGPGHKRRRPGRGSGSMRMSDLPETQEGGVLREALWPVEELPDSETDSAAVEPLVECSDPDHLSEGDLVQRVAQVVAKLDTWCLTPADSGGIWNMLWSFQSDPTSPASLEARRDLESYVPWVEELIVHTEGRLQHLRKTYVDPFQKIERLRRKGLPGTEALDVRLWRFVKEDPEEWRWVLLDRLLLLECADLWRYGREALERYPELESEFLDWSRPLLEDNYLRWKGAWFSTIQRMLLKLVFNGRHYDWLAMKLARLEPRRRLLVATALGAELPEYLHRPLIAAECGDQFKMEAVQRAIEVAELEFRRRVAVRALTNPEKLWAWVSIVPQDRGRLRCSLIPFMDGSEPLPAWVLGVIESAEMRLAQEGYIAWRSWPMTILQLREVLEGRLRKWP